MSESLFLVANSDGSKPEVIRTANSLLAVREALRRRSVGELKRGVVIAAWRLGNFPEQFHAAYDGEPLTEVHGATDAELVVRSLGNPRV